MSNFRKLLEDSRFTQEIPPAFHTYQSGEIILEEDDEGRDVFFVLKGKVQVTTHVQQHVGQIAPVVAILGEDDFFGELSMIDGEPRSARVVAMSDCEVARFDGRRMLAYMDSNPEKGYLILRDIFMRLIEHMRKNTLLTKTVLQLYLVENQ